MSWYVKTSLCHACYISEYVCLRIFRVNVLLKRHLSRGHRISCPAQHLHRTDNKPLSRLIGLTHKQVGQLPIKTGWWDAPLAFCNLAKAFLNTTPYVTGTVFKRTITQFVNEHSTILPNWPNDWLALWVLICTLKHLFRGRRSLTFSELKSVYSLWNAYVTW